LSVYASLNDVLVTHVEVHCHLGFCTSISVNFCHAIREPHEAKLHEMNSLFLGA